MIKNRCNTDVFILYAPCFVLCFVLFCAIVTLILLVCFPLHSDSHLIDTVFLDLKRDGWEWPPATRKKICVNQRPYQSMNIFMIIWFGGSVTGTGEVWMTWLELTKHQIVRQCKNILENPITGCCSKQMISNNYISYSINRDKQYFFSELAFTWNHAEYCQLGVIKHTSLKIKKRYKNIAKRYRWQYRIQSVTRTILCRILFSCPKVACITRALVANGCKNAKAF